MAYYSDDIIEQVRGSNDIVDIISGYVNLTRKGNSYVGLCPFHAEKSPSFSVSADTQLYHCFGCGAGGNVFTFLMEYENMTFPEAVKELAARASISLPQSDMSKEAAKEVSDRSVVLEINKYAAKYFYSLLHNNMGKRALDYFKSRGLSDSTIAHFGLGYSSQYSNDLYNALKKQGYLDDIIKKSGVCNIEEKTGGRDRFWNRAMFPIMDERSHVIGFGARVMGDGEPKYLNSPETIVFDKGRNLYGLNFAKKSKRKGFILCEGYMDVITLHQAGFDNAVATLGTALTPGHASLLKRLRVESVYLCYDSDKAGTKAALRAIPILRQFGISSRIIHMEPYKDPDEFIKNLGADEYEERINQAQNGFYFELDQIEKKYDMNDPAEKTRFFQEVSSLILTLEKGIEMDSYIQSVAQKYSIPIDDIKSAVSVQAAKGYESKKSKPLKSGIQSHKKEDATLQSQKMLLTWIVQQEGLIDRVSEYITAEDFTDEFMHQIASGLFEQAANGRMNPAALVSEFEDEQSQRKVADIFNTPLEMIESQEARNKALYDIIIKIKENSIENTLANLADDDIEGQQKYIENKKRLDKLKSGRIII